MRRILFTSILILLISSAAFANSSLSKAMDINLIFETGGDANWFFQTTPYFFDYDSVRSGDIVAGQVSWMQTTVYGPGTLSFFWKIASDCDGDDIQFLIDGEPQNRISETLDWHQMTYEITGLGSHTLEWRYIKDSGNLEGDDDGWVCVDLLRWSGETKPVPVAPLSKALDTTLDFKTGGAADWFSQTETAFNDGDAAQSGNIAESQESFIQTTVEGPGKISFYWKICSEADFDFLEFYIDGVLQDRISGSVDFQQMTYNITGSGSHTLKWRYVKDVSINKNNDCCWLDLIEWCSNEQCSVSTPLSRAMDTCLIFETGGDAIWFSQTRPYFFDYDSARSGDISDGQVSWMTTNIYGPGTLSFCWKISSDRDGDDIQFFIDGQLQDRLCETMEWHEMTYEVTGSGTHMLEWRYINDSGKTESDSSGWVCVDRLRWSGQTQAPPVITLSEALDTNLNLTTGGGANWFSQTDTAFSGGDAARSGNVADNQESFLQTTVNGTGTISFYWKVSSEADYDFLEFYIDGVIQDQISGLVDWQQKTYEITNSGPHILEWRYVKDVSLAENDDCGWLDLVKWPE